MNHDSQPISGLEVYPWLLKKASELDRLNLGVISRQFKSVTNDEGVATFDWMPAWQRDKVTFWQLSKQYERIRGIYNPVADDGLLEVKLRRLVPIRGRVVDVAGNPVEGIEIRAAGVDYSADDFLVRYATDANGEYEIRAAANKLYLVTIVDDNWAANAQTGFAVYPNQPVNNIDFQLREGTKLYGRLINATTGDPIANSAVTLIQEGSLLDELPDVEIPNPENSRKMFVQPTVARWIETNAEGEYQFQLGDGTYSLIPPGAGRAKKVTIAGEAAIEITLPVELEAKQRLSGLVVQKQDGAPVENAELFANPKGSGFSEWQAKTDQAGNFLVMRGPADSVVRAYSPDGKLAGFAELDADKRNVILELEPVGQAEGRIVSTEGQPIAAQKLRLLATSGRSKWGNRWQLIISEPSNGEPIYTDDQGRFQLANLIPGYRYQVRLDQALGKSELCFEFTAESGKITDLGDAKVPPRGIEPLFPD
ncbi:carboxypeptidase regulatory-like domain-containing protein [Planctomycetaceae bacterium SH139]